MTRFVLLALLLSLGSGLYLTPLAQDAAADGQEVVARLHFIGFDQLKATTNATTLSGIWSLPETARLRALLQDKIARAIAASFQASPENTTNDPAALIRPLLEDLLTAESFIEVSRTGTQGRRCTLAIRLPQERMDIWATNCSQLLKAGTLGGPSAKSRLSHGSFRSWFVITSQPAADKTAAATADGPLIERIKKTDRPVQSPKDYLLKAEADFARLNLKLPFFAEANQPRAELTLIGKGERLRAETRLMLSDPIRWQLEKWEIPTHAINDPQGTLMSFTGVQGIGPWLSRQPVVRDLAINPVPNQFFAWGDSHAPLQIQVAAPVNDVTNVLAKFGKQWVPKLNTDLSRLSAGGLEFLTNKSQVLWRGLPIMPYLRPAREPQRDFLSAGLFPVEVAHTNPPPTELLEQLTSQANLLYYDWEITQDRLAQLRHLALFLPLFLDLPNLEADAASYKWLDAVGPKLGNAVTEVSAVSSREIRVTRNSQIGFNGTELMALAYWFESTNFPRMNFKVSFRPSSQPKREAAGR